MGFFSNKLQKIDVEIFCNLENFSVKGYIIPNIFSLTFQLKRDYYERVRKRSF